MSYSRDEDVASSAKGRRVARQPRDDPSNLVNVSDPAQRVRVSPFGSLLWLDVKESSGHLEED